MNDEIKVGDWVTAPSSTVEYHVSRVEGQEFWTQRTRMKGDRGVGIAFSRHQANSKLGSGWHFTPVQSPSGVAYAVPALKTPFLQVVDEIVAMHNKKQADYGRTGDPFANVRASSDFGVDSWIGCMIRANDKMKRIQKAASGDTLVNESLEDSLLDLAVYSIIALVLRREQVAKLELASEYVDWRTQWLKDHPETKPSDLGL